MSCLPRGGLEVESTPEGTHQVLLAYPPTDLQVTGTTNSNMETCLWFCYSHVPFLCVGANSATYKVQNLPLIEGRAGSFTRAYAK